MSVLDKKPTIKYFFVFLQFVKIETQKPYFKQIRINQIILSINSFKVIYYFLHAKNSENEYKKQS